MSTNFPDPQDDPLVERLSTQYAAMIERAEALAEGFTRAPVKVDSDEIVDKCTSFAKQFKAHASDIEKARKAEKEDFLKAGRTVDAFFNALSEQMIVCARQIENRIGEYLRAKEAEARRIAAEKAAVERAAAERVAAEIRAREEAARKAQEEAERKANALKSAAAKAKAEEAAAIAAQAAEAARREAEENRARQEEIEREARAAEAAKAADLVRTRGTLGGLATLKTFWDFDNVDRSKLDLEKLRPYIPQPALDQAIRAFVKAGGRDLAGARIFENRQTRVA